MTVLLLGTDEQHDVVIYNYSGDDGCTFTVNIGQPSFRSYEDRWYPVINGMETSFGQNQYVLPCLTCYIPIPPGCEPEISCSPRGSQPVSLPGPLLVTPVMKGTGLDTEWEIPSGVPAAESDDYVELRTFRMAGTTVAAVTVNPFRGNNTRNIPQAISVRLTWPRVDGGRIIDSPLLAALIGHELLYWPENGRTDVTSPFWGRPWARMAVSSTGIHAVTGSELEQAGCEITGTPSKSLRVFSGPGTQFDLEDPSEEHLLSELAVEVCDGGDGVFNGSDTLLFFGQGLNRFDVSNGYLERLSHRYAAENVYWLTWGGENGLRIDTLSAVPDASPSWGDSLLYSTWNEQDYAWVAGQEKKTGWVWTQLYENVPGYFYFSTPSFDGSGSLTFSIVPEFSNNTPHRIICDLNGSVIEDTVWSGDDEVVFNINNLEFDPSMNLLKVTAVDDPGIIFFNYYRVDYERRLSYAANRMLRFTDAVPGKYNFSLGGAGSKYSLLDVTNPAVPERLEGELSGTELKAGLVLQQNSQYWLSAGAESYLSPDLSVSEPGRIIGSGIHGDVVVVVADELMDAAEPIKAIYAARGLSTVLVSTSEVYNEFGQGIRDPGAIRAFFRYTQDHWSEPAQSLLLVGDGSFDPLMHITSYPTFIPACILLNSTEGTNYDDIYVIAHESGYYPEVPISRISASSDAELAAYLSKVMIYDSHEESGQWENRILLTADDEWGRINTQEFGHTRSCELLADSILPTSLDRIKFYMIEYPWPPGTSSSGIHPEKPEARIDFIQELSEGCANMIFFGHGSYGQLAKEKLLVSSDVELIDNGSRQPLMIFASCDLAHFDMISANCLAENFELKPGSGAIASIGATRGTLPGSNEVLFSRYYSEIYGSGSPTASEALWLAKVQLTGNYHNSKYYVLLGDGGVRTVYPSNTGCSLEIPADTLRRGKINTVSGSFQNSSIGFLKITESGAQRVYNGFEGGHVTYLRYGSPIYQSLVTATGREFSSSFFMPLQADTGSYSRGSAVGISGNGCEVAFNEWADLVDDGNYAVDSVPPLIELWIDGYRGEDIPSVSGTAVLKALLSDSSGICTLGGSAGRSILLSLDSRGFDISRYFTYNPDSYTTGEIEYTLPELIEGNHRIILVAWDGMGNTARDTLDFKTVASNEDLLSSVFVYPNPGEGNRCFNFETSSAGSAVITVYTVAGRTVWRKTVTCEEGYTQVTWNGLDMDFDEPASGAYIYRIEFSTADGRSGSITAVLAIVRNIRNNG